MSLSRKLDPESYPYDDDAEELDQDGNVPE